jgi:hypothetical protein
MQEFECCNHVFTEIIREDGVIQRVANKQPVEWNFCPICGERIPWNPNYDDVHPGDMIAEEVVDLEEETVTVTEDDVFEEFPKPENVTKQETKRPIRNLQDYLDQEVEAERVKSRKRASNYRVLCNLNLIKRKYGYSSKPAYKLQKQPVFDPRKYFVPQFA